MKRLPLGIQTFSEMIEDNHFYVDKTEFVSRLAAVGKYFFLSRPRRFGKSSFLDTLKEAYEGNKQLFAGLHLENHWDWNKNYPVVKISFGGGQTTTLASLQVAMQDMFLAFEEYFSLQLKSQSLAGKLKELLFALYKRTGNKVVVLIDEYDKPILDVIEKDKIAISVRDELKSLYSVIKDADAYVKFVFITGVSKFSRVNLFSGLNNLTDITLDSEFATICGYTQQEIEHTFHELLDNVPMGLLKEWYNGYNFRGEKVYNPYNILHYLKNNEFHNYWFETGTPSFLIKLIEKRKFPIPNLEKIEITNEALNSFDVNSIQLEAVLFQTGYLTIQKIEQRGIMKVYTLEYPNIEVKSSLTDSILKYLLDVSTEKERNKSKLYDLLYNGGVEHLKELFHSFFASIPYHWYTNNTIANYEGYYSSVVYTYFAATGIEVKVEDVSNHGRIDLVAILNSRCYILEFKVNEFTQDSSAIGQLQQKKYHEKYVGYESTYLDSGSVREIYLVGIEFSKTDRNITGFDWQQVV